MTKENNKNNLYLILDGGLNGQFKFDTKSCIGKGTFGKLFKGRNLHTFEEVAIKTEPIKSVQLLKENHFYRMLGANQRNHNIPGVPEIYYMRNIGLHCMALAMEMLGPTLDDLFRLCGKKFSLKTVLLIALQTISRVEHVHKCKLIHRDIKPENFLIGRSQQILPHKESKEHIIYMIDFGMSKMYIEPQTEKHIPYNKQAGMYGTYHFMSGNAHSHIEQSRRDDLEALGYTFLYYINGTLPWMKLENGEDIGPVRYGEMKNKITVKELCKGLPDVFSKYFNYVKHLEFSEEPDYNLIKSFFTTTFEQNKFTDDKSFDWTKK